MSIRSVTMMLCFPFIAFFALDSLSKHQIELQLLGLVTVIGFAGLLGKVLAMSDNLEDC